jgi:prepilin-type N-terminal cleavage/methylation domain-containing protein
MYMYFQTKKQGFTLVEMMVVVSIIGILASIIYANFGSARALSRDDVRKSALKETQLALELYKAQHGSYPLTGCGAGAGVWAGPGPTGGAFTSAQSCTVYIPGLAPGFIAVLPADPSRENEAGFGFYYRSDGASYKLVNNAVEQKLISSYNDEFARCPQTGGGCTGASPVGTHYAVYSSGAVQW